MMEGTKIINIKPGIEVKVMLKKHQVSGELTEGTVKHILTKVSNHRYGIKVRLEDGQVGRVKEIIDLDE